MPEYRPDQNPPPAPWFTSNPSQPHGFTPDGPTAPVPPVPSFSGPPAPGAGAYETARPPLSPLPAPPGTWPSSPPSGPHSMPSGTGVAGGPAAGPLNTAGDRKGRKGLAALAIVAVFAAGTGGVLAGKNLADENSTNTVENATAVDPLPITSRPGPVSGDASEPAAAVAAALAPAVVQIETGRGLGSGFVYDKSGLILTAAHVTDGATSVTVRLADGTKTTGEVLGSDDSTDVAVVKIDGNENLPVAVLATGVQLQVGQTAIAIGSPFGLDQTVTTGIVSAVGRSTATPGGVIPAIQTDAPINSGNSGGALADRQGRVIGINSSIITGNSQARGNVGVGFAIPIDIAKAVADKIVAGESTEAGFLGVGGADATGDRAGAAITSVEAGSPASDAGITDNDVVTAVDGQKVASMIDLAAAVRTKAPGERVTLTLVRAGRERSVEVTLVAAPASSNTGSRNDQTPGN